MIWNADTIDLARINAFGQQGMSAQLGIVFVDYGDDWLAAEMPVDERTVQPFGRLHGDERPSVGGAHVEDADDVGLVHQGHRPRFAEEPRASRACRRRRSTE